MNNDIPTDIQNMIIEYRTGLYFNDVQCQLNQRFLHNRLMKEIFYNRYKIYYKFVEKEPIVHQNFITKGEFSLDYWGFGHDQYMEDFWLRFEILAEDEDPNYYSDYHRNRSGLLDIQI